MYFVGTILFQYPFIKLTSISRSTPTSSTSFDKIEHFYRYPSFITVSIAAFSRQTQMCKYLAFNFDIGNQLNNSILRVVFVRTCFASCIETVEFMLICTHTRKKIVVKTITTFTKLMKNARNRRYYSVKTRYLFPDVSTTSIEPSLYFFHSN